MADETLISAFRSGDKAALDVLLTRYKPLVKAKARAYFVAGGDAEDLIQEGMIGLYKAVLDFDAAKNSSFAAFAALCIVRQVQTAIKAAARRKHMPLNESLSLDNVSGNGSSEKMTYLAKLPGPATTDPEALFLDREALRDTEDFIKRSLSGLEYRVLKLHMDGKTHAQIAEALNKNAKSIDNTLQRVRKKLSSRAGV